MTYHQDKPREVESVVDLPPIDAELNSHEWIQRGNHLECVDTPELSATLPHGKHLVGKRGEYRIVEEGGLKR